MIPAAVMRRIQLIALAIILESSTFYAAQFTNWAGDFAPCDRRFELLKHDRMTLGVRISTCHHSIGKEFRKAMDFWSTIVDMDWYDDDTSSCSINVVDGTPEIFVNAVIARSQFTEWDNFQGWVAFDGRAPLSKQDLYLTSAHEIGHLLGLKHNPSASSIMYFLDLDGTEVVDADDLAALALHHKLRIPVDHEPILVARRD